MASVASQLIEEVTAHAQSDSLEDAREICADGTYFPNNLRMKTPDMLRYQSAILRNLISLCKPTNHVTETALLCNAMTNLV